MPRTRTLAQLEADVRRQADMQRAQLRHPSTELRAELNQSIRRYREFICDLGHSHFLQSFSGLLTPGQAVDKSDGVTPLSWGLLRVDTLDPPFLRVYGVDVALDNGEVRELEQIEWKQRNYMSDSSHIDGVPLAFFVYDGDQLGLVPPPGGPYRYTIWYLADIRELVEDEDEFDPGMTGGDRWVVLDACHKIAHRDNFPSLLSYAEREREAVRASIVARAGKIGMAAPMKRIDTRGRSRNKARFNRFGFR